MDGLDQPLVPCHMVNIQSNYAAVTLFVRVVVHVINLGAVKDVRKGHTPMGHTAEVSITYNDNNINSDLLLLNDAAINNMYCMYSLIGYVIFPM